ncbi:MAG: hypothetical protein ACFE0S_10215 [Rhodospirillales bacterium]
MKLIGGAFGEGYASYWPHSKELKIRPDGIFASERVIPLRNFKEVQPLTAESSKKMGEATALGGGVGFSGVSLGMVVGGPIGAIIGGLTGATLGAMMGGKKDETVFGITFKDNQAVLIKASMKDFGKLQNDFLTSVNSSASPSRKKANPTKRKSPKQKKSSSAPLHTSNEVSLPNEASRSRDLEQRLAVLKQLLDKELINEEEYKAQRNAIISKI